MFRRQENFFVDRSCRLPVLTWRSGHSLLVVFLLLPGRSPPLVAAISARPVFRALLVQTGAPALSLQPRRFLPFGSF